MKALWLSFVGGLRSGWHLFWHPVDNITCKHPNAKIIWSDNACAVEECPDCHHQRIYGSP